MRKNTKEFAHLTNREKVLKPRRGKHWCDACDGDIVAIGGRCGTCGKKQAERRLRK